MKLNSKNRSEIKQGDILRFLYGDSYYVLAVLKTGRSISFTMQDTKTKQIIYCFPSSQCYGAEIISGGVHE